MIETILFALFFLGILYVGASWAIEDFVHDIHLYIKGEE